MLSVSSDTNESHGSREIGHNGFSRSSTPDSSASSRLAAQLERSAYRRSRSRTRRKPNSKQGDADSGSISPRKTSRIRNSKQQQRSTRLDSDDEQTTENGGIKNSNLVVQTNEHVFCEHEEQMLSAQPVGTSYTVNCITNGYNVHRDRRTDLSDYTWQTRQPNHGTEINSKLSERKTDFSPNNSRRKALSNDEIVNHSNDKNKNYNKCNVSKVRFEESWSEAPTRKCEYRVRETTGMAIQSRDETSYQNRSEIQRTNVFHGGRANTSPGKVNEVISASEQSYERKEKVMLHAESAVSKTNNVSQNHAELSGKFVNNKIPLDCNRLDIDARDNGERLKCAQGRLENNQNEDSKPLGLRQLIKIHEIQIAEVAKSAASMKKPQVEKAHEGRLVKVKIVPESKQPHVKQNVAKVTFAGNKPSAQNAIIKKTPRIEGKNDAVENNHGQTYIRKVTETSTNEKPVRGKRHTVELRTKPPIQEDHRWKRHTAIGLVGYNNSKEEISHGERSQTDTNANRLFSGSDDKMNYTRRHAVETEKVYVDGRITRRRDESPQRTALVTIEGNESLKEKEEVDMNDSDVPPERPPLPKNFYGSSEEIVIKHAPPAYKTTPLSDDKTKTNCYPPVAYKTTAERILPPSTDNSNNRIDRSQAVKDIKRPTLIEQTRTIPLSSSLPAIHVSSAIMKSQSDGLIIGNEMEEKDHVLGKNRTTQEMYEERLSRINLVPLDLSAQTRASNIEMVNSLCSSIESVTWDTSCNAHNSGKNEYLEKFRTCMKQMKVLTKEKEDLERMFERERRDWRRKYEEQQKVAKAYQKLEDRYRRQVQELQEALKSCRCKDTTARKALSHGNFWKRNDPYLLTNQTQSILHETEEWLRAQSVRSDITCNSESVSNIRLNNEQSSRGQLADLVAEKNWSKDYKGFTCGIDEYNGTSV